jgi:hypothetical protein
MQMDLFSDLAEEIEEDEDQHEEGTYSPRFHHATPEAQAWLHHLATTLLQHGSVPAHLARPLEVPTCELPNTLLLNRAETLLGLWRRYYQPLTEVQANGYQLLVGIQLHGRLDCFEKRYLGHLLATASAQRLVEVNSELTLTGQLRLPVEFREPEDKLVIPVRVPHAQGLTRGNNQHYLTPLPELS